MNGFQPRWEVNYCMDCRRHNSSRYIHTESSWNKRIPYSRPGTDWHCIYCGGTLGWTNIWEDLFCVNVIEEIEEL
jgi:hypothetical protein